MPSPRPRNTVPVADDDYEPTPARRAPPARAPARAAPPRPQAKPAPRPVARPAPQRRPPPAPVADEEFYEDEAPAAPVQKPTQRNAPHRRPPAPPARRAPPARPVPQRTSRIQPEPEDDYVDDGEEYYEDDVQDEYEPAPPRRGQFGARGQRAERQRVSHLKPGQSRRRKRGTAEEDPFYIAPEMIPEGMSIEWKRETYAGKEEDAHYHVGLQEQGWETLSLKAYPEFRPLVPSHWAHDYVKRKGLVLMIRPIELTEEAIAEDAVMAKTQLRDGLRAATQQPNDTTAPRTNKGKPLAKIRRSYERPQVVE